MSLGLTRTLAEQVVPPAKMPPVPLVLALGHQMQRWGTLLVQGGLLDQPACLMRDIEAALDEEARFLLAQDRLKSSAQS